MEHGIARPTPAPAPLASSLNLKCVRMEVADAETRVSIAPEFRAIPPLVFKRPDAPVSLHSPSSAPNTHSLSFSAYLGHFSHESKHFLVFATRVVPIKFGRCEIQRVQQVVAYPLHATLPDIVLSQTLTDLLGDRLFFSYHLDLTQNLHEAYTSPGLSPNPFFAALSNLFLTDYLQAEFNWLLPAVIGTLSTVRYGHVDLFLLSKESVFDISPVCQGDLGLMMDFYAPTNLDCVQFAVMEGDTLRAALTFAVSGFPGIVQYVNDDNEKLEGSNFNPQRIYRFLQFFNEFLRCEHFVYRDSPNAHRVFRKLSKFVRSAGVKGPGVCAAEKFVGVPADAAWEEIAKNAEFLGQKHARSGSDCIDFSLVFISERRPTESELVFRLFLRGFLANKDFQGLLGSHGIDNFLNSAAGNDFLGNFAVSSRTFSSAMARALAVPLRKHPILSDFATFEGLYPRIFGGKHFVSHFIDKAIRAVDSTVFSVQDLKLTILIHNCAGTIPDNPAEVGYLRDPTLLSSDLVLVGLQEIVEMKSKNLRSMFTNENNKQTQGWADFFHTCLPEFLVLGGGNMLGLQTLLLVSRSTEDRFEISLEKQTRNKMGFMNLLANKGFVALTLKVNYDSILLANCHFEAGNSKENYYRRVEHLTAALSPFLSPFLSKSAPSLGFVFGDMNFRCDLPQQDFERLLIDMDHPGNQAGVIGRLLEADQLRQYMTAESLMAFGVFEHPIDFRPTYKLVPRTSRYQPTQAPSW